MSSVSFRVSVSVIRFRSVVVVSFVLLASSVSLVVLLLVSVGGCFLVASGVGIGVSFRVFVASVRVLS